MDTGWRGGSGGFYFWTEAHEGEVAGAGLRVEGQEGGDAARGVGDAVVERDGEGGEDMAAGED